MNGLVESFDSHRGLGCITAGGIQYLFHCAEIVDGTRAIEIGTKVSFDVAMRFGNVEASQITKL